MLCDGDATITSPTDLVAYLGCRHRTWMDVAAARTGHRSGPLPDEARVVAARGDAHESKVLERLTATYGPPMVFATPDPGVAELAAADAASGDALRARHPFLYQPTFYDRDTGTTGRADFVLYDRDTGTYIVADAKLASRATAAAAVQCTEYARHVERHTGTSPTTIRIISPAASVDLDVNDVSPYTRHAHQRFTSDLDAFTQRALAHTGRPFEELTTAADDLAGYPNPCEDCARCPWRTDCADRRRREDHISLIAGIRRSTISAGVAAGIVTVVDAATAPEAVGNSVAAQAAAQIASRGADTPTVEVKATSSGRGLAALPEPHPSDLFFDFEGDPLVAGGGLEYLAGIWVGDPHTGTYRAWWSHDHTSESEMTADLLRWIAEHIDMHPGAHVYHYAPYETAALHRLCDRHGHSHELLNQMLAAGVFIDLYAVVREGLIVGTESYSIKYLEPCYGLNREADVTTSLGSVVAYEDYLNTVDADTATAILDGIEAYNLEDCRSTSMCRDWLESLRETAAVDERPGHTDDESDDPATLTELNPRSAERALRRTELTELTGQLNAAGGSSAATLGGIINWFDKESSAAWREYFERKSASTPRSDLEQDSSAITDLTVVAREGNAVTFTYPDQDHKLSANRRSDWVDRDTGKRPKAVVDVDREQRRVTLEMAPEAPIPDTLIEGPPPNTDAQATAVAQEARRHLEGAPTPALECLLSRRAPKVLNGAAAPIDVDSVCAVASGLTGETLAVQGPPGTGKTYLGAHLIAHLISTGATVGICGPSHRVIDNLLESTITLLTEQEVRCAVLRRCPTESAARYEAMTTDVVDVVAAKSNGVVATAFAGKSRALGTGRTPQLFAGTSWAFTSKEFQGLGEPLDHLIIDEAGQFSLASAIAVGPTAKNLVLLGDPAQLPQVEVAGHGDHSSLSALGHITGRHGVLDPHVGVFLPESRRMGASLCGAVSRLSYQGQLRSHPSASDRHLVVTGRRVDGVQYVPVPHRRLRTTTAPEEVAATVNLVEQLLGSVFVSGEEEHALTPDDFVVIAPYNTHVERLAEALARRWPGFEERVGTVDRFQGLEAPIAIYSLGSSGGDDPDARRDAFLFSTQRLNVAVSRAMAAAFIVASPEVAEHCASDLDALVTLSRFCDLIDHAAVWPPPDNR